MIKRITIGLLAALMPAGVFAASLGYQQSTSLSTSSAINLPNIPSRPGSAIIAAEGAGIRWRDDGTDPTSSVGQPVAAGQALCYSQDLNGVRVIAQTAGATLNVTYYAGKGCAQ